MEPEKAYDLWSEQYDTNSNKTRDLEGIALRSELADIKFKTCLEIGCGTGKNTEWLLTRAEKITAADLSAGMLEKAKRKINSPKVLFVNCDIRKEWDFVTQKYDLVSFSLVLEHIEDLDHIFKESAKVLNPGGYLYAGELHPYKQYNGTKAGFESEEGKKIATCFNHNISDFIIPAKKYGMKITEVNEYFDNDDRTQMPRILTILFRKNSG
ncbi:MAG TPA: class I SAM-dependent methyltransferase [Ignavibacteria bacterium]|nr:SAM-dependent methyltransferase [Bacteroidota bacterium]HRI85866.1 class I SAM-dependent methyltransferase [Ignavibacteria bacterium]HRK00402.1 class I SAM-dependent methyltransferase [Ignavibacteria bacterium]